MSTPMPRPAPVTRTTFFSDMFSSSRWRGGGARGLRALSTSISPTPRQHRFTASGQDLRRGVLAVTPSGMWAGPTLDAMDDKEAARAAVREFLTTRRARVTPADAGLPPQGTRRRVKGLRREEVALLAGVSPEYYVRLERGQATGPSAGVVDAVADVLRLDDDERAHLEPAARRPHPRGPQAEPGRGEGPGHPGRAGAARLAGPPARGGVQRPARHPRRQRAGAGALRTGVRPARATQQRPLPVPRRAPGPGPVPRVGPDRGRHRGDAADRGRPPPRRPRADRADRAAVHPQHRIPHPLGRPTTSGPTGAARRSSGTRSSARSRCRSRTCTSTPSPARCSPSSPRSPAAPKPTRSACWPAGTPGVQPKGRRADRPGA